MGHQLALLPDEVVELDGVRLTSPARTWLDLASVLGVDDLVVAGDSLVCEHGPEFPFPRDALCRIEDLRSVVARHPGSRGVRKARAAVELIRVGADSPPETRLRLLLGRAGLPELVPNLVVTEADPWGGPGRSVLWPDAACPQWRVALQYEGVHHNGEDQYLRDIASANSAAPASITGRVTGNTATGAGMARMVPSRRGSPPGSTQPADEIHFRSQHAHCNPRDLLRDDRPR